MLGDEQAGREVLLVLLGVLVLTLIPIVRPSIPRARAIDHISTPTIPSLQALLISELAFRVASILLHLGLLCCDNISEVRPALHRDVLAGADMITNVQSSPTEVIAIILVLNAGRACNDKIDAISILGQIIPIRLILRQLLLELMQSINLVLKDGLVPVSHAGILSFISCKLLHLFLLFDLFTRQLLLRASDVRAASHADHRIVVITHSVLAS